MKAFHEAKLGRRDFLLHCHELTIRKTAALNMRVAFMLPKFNNIGTSID